MTDGLTLSEITLSVARRILIDRLSLRIVPGEVVSVMGPSGSGKSSLIAYLSGSLDRRFKASGSVTLDGIALDPLPIDRRRIGVLFQDDLLFAHMSIGENLAFALPQRIGRRERRAYVDRALAEAELDGFAARAPDTLSGGQRARVALMRALLAEPRALLLDEPFSRLDVSLRGRMRDFTFATIAARSIPALLVTHDEQDAPGRVIHLKSMSSERSGILRRP